MPPPPRATARLAVRRARGAPARAPQRRTRARNALDLLGHGLGRDLGLGVPRLRPAGEHLAVGVAELLVLDAEAHADLGCPFAHPEPFTLRVADDHRGHRVAVGAGRDEQHLAPQQVADERLDAQVGGDDPLDPVGRGVSKSIVDVVRILLETGKYDSALVGILILIFSIVFPIGKLLATKCYLLGNEKWRNNKVIQFFAFKSGKWSMADVNVVAIFMAYIGFKGILDSQLSGLNLQTDSLASISTNETTLQPGFILFVAFVLFGLILSVILQKITSAEVPDKLIKANHFDPAENKACLNV